MWPVGELVVGIGSGAGDVGTPPTDVVLSLGTAHPSAHGVLRLRLTVEGSTIRSAEPLIGYLHRGAEKLFEARDYRQIMVLANRHDWLSAFAGELGVALTVEQMLGLEVPERATWLRMLFCELNRVLSHLMFLGSFPLDSAAATALRTAMRARETIQAVMEEASGGRMHFMIAQIGGLKQDVPAGWDDRARAAVDTVRGEVESLAALILADEAFAARTVGVGVLGRDTALRYAVSGPVARASGLDLDLRRDEPYLAYAAVRDVLRVVGRDEGDCHARYGCLLEQIPASLDLAVACLDRLSGLSGPVNVRLPKSVRAPEGHHYAWTETALGISGYYLVSRGDRAPWRLKLRSASFNNVQVLRALLPGTEVEDLVTILGSLFFVVGDIDR